LRPDSFAERGDEGLLEAALKLLVVGFEAELGPFA
jgi:hypothetical protein